MVKGIVVARMTVDCGYFNELEMWLLLDGTLHVSYSHLWPNVVSDVLVKWTPRDLIVASEYVAHRQDYYKAERGFRYVLYSRGCIAPRYPVPAPIGLQGEGVPFKRAYYQTYLASLSPSDCVNANNYCAQLDNGN